MNDLPIRTIMAGLIFVVVSGFVAWFGDWLGRKLGRRRVSLFGLRPRHTAVVVTAITGSVIALATIGVLLGTEQTFRTVIISGERTIRELRREQARYESLNKDFELLQKRYARARSEVADQQKQIVENARRLELQSKQLEQAAKLLQERSQRITALNAQAVALQRRITQQQQRVTALTAQNAQLFRRNAQLIREAQRMQKSNDFLNSQNARNAELNRQALRQSFQVQSNNLLLQRQNEELKEQTARLEDQRRELAAQSDRLGQQITELNATIRALASQELELRQTVNELATRTALPVIARKDEEIARRAIPDRQSMRTVMSELHKLLVECERVALERGAAKGSQIRAAYIPIKRVVVQPEFGPRQEVVADEQESLRVLAFQISTSNSPVVVVAQAIRNCFEGEPIAVELRPYRNPLVYKAGEEIARIRLFTGRGSGQVSNDVVLFLRTTVKQKAMVDGIIPVRTSDGDDTVGGITNAELADLVERIISEGAGRHITLVARADQDIRAGDQLKLRFRLLSR